MRPTDWEKYYEHRSMLSKISGFLCRRTLENILCGNALNDSHIFNTIVELGGGNSIIYPWLRKRYPQSNIILVDKETFSEPAFRSAAKNDRALACVQQDLLEDIPESMKGAGDLVLSLGLVEHFCPAETRKMIERHFACCKPGGVVLISFPCPTRLYRCTRRMMELLGAWQFHDERPLHPDEVRAVMDEYGAALCTRLDIRMGLTQQVVVYRKDGDDA